MFFGYWLMKMGNQDVFILAEQLVTPLSPDKDKKNIKL
jgi:hypothetical protein